MTQSPVIDVMQLSSYVFKNRVAPEPPSVLRAENSFKVRCERDEISNAWVWMASEVQARQIFEMAKLFDHRQMEMDLEFCLVALNTDRLKSSGLSVLYDPGASWLSSLQLTPDAGSLRLSLDDWSVSLDFQNTQAAATVVQVPVIRVLDGQPWEFSTDAEVPVPRSDVVDGVIRQSVDFQKTGFGISGRVRVTGPDMILTVEQRNGALVTETVGPQTQYPQFSVQRLNTALRLSLLQWSVLGGMQIDKTELRKGIFGRKVVESSDYLVIFVRPRTALGAPPRAVPVAEDDDDDMPHMLLPPRTRPSVWPDNIPVMKGVLPVAPLPSK